MLRLRCLDILESVADHLPAAAEIAANGAVRDMAVLLVPSSEASSYASQASRIRVLTRAMRILCRLCVGATSDGVLRSLCEAENVVPKLKALTEWHRGMGVAPRGVVDSELLPAADSLLHGLVGLVEAMLSSSPLWEDAPRLAGVYDLVPLLLQSLTDPDLGNHPRVSSAKRRTRYGAVLVKILPSTARRLVEGGRGADRGLEGYQWW